MAVGVDGEVGLAPTFDAVGFFAVFDGPIAGCAVGFSGGTGCGQVAQAVGEVVCGGSVELVDHDSPGAGELRVQQGLSDSAGLGA